MTNKITVYPLSSHEHPAVSGKAFAASFGFPELNEPTSYGRHYPSEPAQGFAESVIAFLRNAMHRR